MVRVRTRPMAERVGAMTARCTGIDELARVVFEVVAAEVPFAFACLATTDPANGLITGAFKSSELPIGDQEFAAAEYGEPDVNKFADIAKRAVPVGVLSVDTDGDPLRCKRIRDYMGPQFGFRDEIRLACIAQGATWGLLGLYRGAGESPFTPREGEAVAAAGEAIADAVRRTLFIDPTAGEADARIPVVLVVDAQDQVTDMSAAARVLIDDLGGFDHGALPAGVLVVAATARTSAQLAEARVRTVAGAWIVVRAMPLEASSGSRSVVLTMDTAPQAAVGQLAVAAKGLTAREQEVVGLVLKGASTQVIAATLHLSPHTVQDHLKAIFAKLDVNSRRQLVALFVLP